MRSLFVMLPLAALIACSQGEPDRARGESPAMQAETADLAAPPGIAVTSAPGVAFSYRYAFTLPAERVSAAQETHAQACEKLGVARCRITGMRYSLIGENRVEAMLSFKLDPTLARQFGKEGIAAIEKAEGTLVDAEITGTDAGAAIDRSTGDGARAQDELRRIDRELARQGLRPAERAELQRQRADIAQRIEAARADVADQRESLANTPMVFDYRSGRAIRGFDASAPLTSAVDTAVASIQATLAILLGAIALLGPPALVIALLWFGWIQLRRRLPERRKPPVAPSADPVPPA